MRDWYGEQPALLVLHVSSLAPRRTRRTSLPSCSVPMMRYVQQGQEVGSSTSQPDSESMRMGGRACTHS